MNAAAAYRLDNLATVFLLAPVAVMSALDKRVPRPLIYGLIVVTVWQGYRAVVDLMTTRGPASTDAFVQGY